MKTEKCAGLYGKYHLRKADGRDVDPDGAYFVLKLNSKDKVHGLACRRALSAYIKTLERHNHLPELAADLTEWLVDNNPNDVPDSVMSR